MGLETAGWTRERGMNLPAMPLLIKCKYPFSFKLLMNPNVTYVKRPKQYETHNLRFLAKQRADTKNRTDTIEPLDCSKLPKTSVLSYLAPTSPTRVRTAQWFQKTRQNKKGKKKGFNPKSQRIDPERRMDPRARDGPERGMDSIALACFG